MLFITLLSITMFCITMNLHHHAVTTITLLSCSPSPSPPKPINYPMTMTPMLTSTLLQDKTLQQVGEQQSVMSIDQLNIKIRKSLKGHNAKVLCCGGGVVCCGVVVVRW